jgi:hypothetical protein
MRLTLFCAHSTYIAHLEAEIAWYRERVDLERRRAENAIDLLLALRVPGASAISPPPTPAESVAEQLLKDAEFTGVGRSE